MNKSYLELCGNFKVASFKYKRVMCRVGSAESIVDENVKNLLMSADTPLDRKDVSSENTSSGSSSLPNLNVFHLPSTSFQCPSPYYFRPPNNLTYVPVWNVSSLPNLCYQLNQTTCYSPLFLNMSNLRVNPFNLDIRRHYHAPRSDRDRSIKRKRDAEVMSLRLWEKVANVTKPTKPGFIFTLMSYNVLAQDLLEQHPELYRHHDSKALPWKIRWGNLLGEIRKFNPDVLCLQEVQESHIEEFYDVLKLLGYQGVFKKRTGIRTDGCAIYFKTDTINLVEYFKVEYFRPPVKLLNRDNVGLIAKLTPKLHPTREFIVSTTHLLYNPRRSDVRLAQMQLLLTEIESISYKRNGNNSLYLPVLITGDLNSTPHSDLYQFLTKGEVNYDDLSPEMLHKKFDVPVLVTATLGISDSCQHVDSLQKRLSNVSVSNSISKPILSAKSRQDIKPPDKSRNCDRESANLFGKGRLTHHFSFRSVYDHGLFGDCVEGTTFQDEWVTVDYIFYSTCEDQKSKQKLQLLSRYRLPTQEELEDVRIPNKSIGSDHLSLIAKFKLEF